MEEKKNYICVRHEKKKSKRGLDGKEKHNKDEEFRKTLDHINPDMTEKNRTIYTKTYDQTKTLYENFEMMADNYQAVKGRKLRSDAVQCIETVYTISSGVIDANNKEEVNKFIKSVLQCHREIFGDCPAMICCHVDESTVHVHSATIPIDKDGKTYNKKVLNKKAFEEIQTKFAKYCQNNGIDVVRGESKAKTKARHKNVKAFMETEEGKQWLENKKQEELNKVLQNIDKEYETIITETKERNETIITELQQVHERKIKNLNWDYENKKQQYEDYCNRKLDIELDRIEQNMNDVIEEYQKQAEMKLQKQLEKLGLSSHINDLRNNDKGR